MAIICTRTGLRLNDDFIRNHPTGMGPDPVSPTYDSVYTSKPVPTRLKDGRTVLMHPLKVCRAQVDYTPTTDAKPALTGPDAVVEMFELQRVNPKADPRVRVQPSTRSK